MPLPTTLNSLLLLCLVSCAGCGATAAQVRQSDLDAWRGVPADELRSHPLFSTLPKTVETLSDGRELWTFKNCGEYNQSVHCATYFGQTTCNGGGTTTVCCHNQFFVERDQVVQYRPVGNCSTDCTVRPDSIACEATESAQARLKASEKQRDANDYY